jgi:hypothetical protein
VLDCIWELFIYVGTEARDKRADIKLALAVAKVLNGPPGFRICILSISKDIASGLAEQRPYTPTIHVLILPSQIPLDLQHHFRDLEETMVRLCNLALSSLMKCL